MFAILSPIIQSSPSFLSDLPYPSLIEAKPISPSLVDLYSSKAYFDRGKGTREKERHEERGSQKTRHIHTGSGSLRNQESIRHPRGTSGADFAVTIPQKLTCPCVFSSHYPARGSDCAVAGCTTQLHNRDQRPSAASSFGTVLQPAVYIFELFHVVQPLDLVKAASTIPLLEETCLKSAVCRIQQLSKQGLRDSSFSNTCCSPDPYE
jgi:hypothetical protein